VVLLRGYVNSNVSQWLLHIVTFKLAYLWEIVMLLKGQITLRLVDFGWPWLTMVDSV
jgi:hypothetical protein